MTNNIQFSKSNYQTFGPQWKVVDILKIEIWLLFEICFLSFGIF